MAGMNCTMHTYRIEIKFVQVLLMIHLCQYPCIKHYHYIKGYEYDTSGTESNACVLAQCSCFLVYWAQTFVDGETFIVLAWHFINSR